MTRMSRAAILTCLFLSALLPLTGCNLISVPLYFLIGKEQHQEVELKQLGDKDKEVKVAILTYSQQEPDSEFMGVERDLTVRLAQFLQKSWKASKAKASVVLPRQIEDYKKQHPDCESPDYAAELGKHFNADYVIVLEINSLSLYLEGSLNTFYQGKTQIKVTLVDVKGGELDNHTKQCSCKYPSEVKGGMMPVGETSFQEFREAFYNSIAERLSWNFVPHSTAAEFHHD